MNSINMDARNFLVMYILSLADKIEGRTRMQKIVFLIQQKIKNKNIDYEFKPFDFGPFSDVLCDVIKNLSENGLLEERVTTSASGMSTKYVYRITEKGLNEFRNISKSMQFKQDELNVAKEIINENKDVGIVDLINRVHSDFPDFVKK